MAGVEQTSIKGEVKVLVEQTSGTELGWPGCVCSGYAKRIRQWRHLDTSQYKTILVAEVPRIDCPEHGVLTVKVPWAEPGSGFTVLFEALVIDWLKEVAKTIKEHLWGILDAVVLTVDNGHAKSISSRIKTIKMRSFHLAALNLYPAGIK